MLFFLLTLNVIDAGIISIIVERSDLADDAKKGLESKEDIRGASQGLKKTAKDRSGISTERINPHDGVKPVMLFHVKGKKCDQILWGYEKSLGLE